MIKLSKDYIIAKSSHASGSKDHVYLIDKAATLFTGDWAVYKPASGYPYYCIRMNNKGQADACNYDPDYWKVIATNNPECFKK